MKIEWLNDELTKAVITRGRWWWKQRATVRLVQKNYSLDWYFASGDDTGILNRLLKEEASDERDRRRQEKRDANWESVKSARLPRAEVRRGR